MKKLRFWGLIALLLWTSAALAQDGETEYLLGGNTRISGFGGLILEFSEVNNQFSVSTGGGGAVLINRSFFLGGYGLGKTSGQSVRISGTEYDLDFSHGGLWAGALIRPQKAVHVGLSSKFGWGEYSLQEDVPNSEYLTKQSIFVITPQVEIDLNILPWFKINLGAGYRLVSGSENRFLGSGNFNSGVMSVGFFFGGFR